jgi:hypothetical protein
VFDSWKLNESVILQLGDMLVFWQQVDTLLEHLAGKIGCLLTGLSHWGL